MPGPRTEQKLWYLRHIRIFEGMPEALAHEIERMTRMEEVGPHEMIYQPKEAHGRVYILKKGAVRIYGLAPDGKRVILDTLQPGDLFGDLGGDAPHAVVGNFAEATTGSLICIAPKADFLRLLHRYPEVALRIIQDLGTRLASAEQKIRDLALHDVADRLVHELTRLAEKSGQQGDVLSVSQRLTHEELGAMIGASRETVTKVLALLRERGIVTAEHGMYRVRRSASPRAENRADEGAAP